MQTMARILILLFITGYSGIVGLLLGYNISNKVTIHMIKYNQFVCFENKVGPDYCQRLKIKRN